MLSRRSSTLLAVGTVAAVAGVSFALLAPSSHKPPSLSRTAASAAPSGSPLAVPPTVAAAIPRSAPVEIKIPSIGVDAQVIPEGTDSAGALQTPPLTEQNVTGWWDGGNPLQRGL